MQKWIKILVVVGFIVLTVFLSIRAKDKTPNTESPDGVQVNNDNSNNSDISPGENSGVNFGVDLEVVGALLTESVWQWVETIYSDDTIVTPKDPTKFSIVFSEGGKFTAKTDCNELFGNYKIAKGSISFTDIASTKKACPGATQEAKFTEMLERAQGFLFTADGALAVTLEYDSGSMIFEPVR